MSRPTAAIPFCRSLFPKTDRVLKRYEFLEFYSLGKAIHSPGFILVYKSGKSSNSRIGITVSRKVGHAVIRNRVKRRIREYYRQHRLQLSNTWDFHVIAKKPAASLTFRQNDAMLAALFDKFGKIAGISSGSIPATQTLFT